MMITLLFAANLFYPQQVLAADSPSAMFEDNFKTGSDTFVLKVKRTHLTVSTGYGEKLEYSIFHNGKFMHPEAYEGGSLIGCRQFTDALKDRNPIQKMEISGVVRGWWISTGNHCGNRGTKRYAAVLPSQKGEGTYKTRVFTSNYMGVLARKAVEGNGVEVWTSQYFDDCGAWTLSYPKFTVLEGQARMPENPEKWPQETEFQKPDAKPVSIYPKDYISRFLAGFFNRNTALLKSALSVFGEQAQPGMPDYCRPEFLPKNKPELQKIIGAFETLEQAGLLEQLRD